MSLAIDPNGVTQVLLADGWHWVLDESFDLDSYEYIEPHPNPDRDGLILHGGGQSGVCATGFRFKEKWTTEVDGTQHDVGDGTEWFYVCGPLTAILAVRTKGS